MDSPRLRPGCSIRCPHCRRWHEVVRAHTEGTPDTVATLYFECRGGRSRLFVKIRKLTTSGYLPERLVLISLDRRAVEMFLDVVDPLDEIVAGANYRADDRELFTALLQKHRT